MYDPCTLALDIKYPWKNAPSPLFPEGYREAFIRIWHEEPRRGACQWVYPDPTPEQQVMLKSMAWDEGYRWKKDFPHFLCVLGRKWAGPRSDAEALFRAAYLRVAKAIGVPCTFDEAARMAALSIHGGSGASAKMDEADMFCFESGYHCNCRDACPEEKHREEHWLGHLMALARQIIESRRRWWQHPRWHFWHWRVQVPALQTLRRVLFDRCATCGQGWTWGAASRGQAISSGWDPPRPDWFKSQTGLHHMDCYPGAKPMMEVVK